MKMTLEPGWPLRRAAFVLALALIGGPGATQAVDTLHSDACLRALEALQAREAVEVAARRAQAASEAPFQRAAIDGLEALRNAAALACLGSRVDTRPPVLRLRAEPPVTVAPIAGLARVGPASAPSGAPITGMSPLPSPRPTLVTSCDPTGCWTNTGQRLSRAGPNLVGPNGICTLQGVILHCP